MRLAITATIGLWCWCCRPANAIEPEFRQYVINSKLAEMN